MPRNQTWNQQGQIVQDLELYREAGVAKLKDWLAGTERNATSEEEATLKANESISKRAEAQARAVQAIRDNATGAPWGRILMDVAVAQGWIEPTA